MTRRGYREVLEELDLLQLLAQYEPMVIGTPPIGIDVSSSDIDIACTAEDLKQFKRDAQRLFSQQAAFVVNDLHWLQTPAVKASFFIHGWDIELFCQSLPIKEQWGVRHFLIEQRILELAPHLRDPVVSLRHAGLKTEPAFARLLALEGDPYEAMLELEKLSDEELVALAGQPM